MLVVIALGGNALLRRGEPLEADVQLRNIDAAARAIAEIAAEHSIVVTHGNGPQVGFLALQAAAYRDVAPYPLDVLGAESEGMIGYLLERELRNQLAGRDVATLLTQVEVDPADPAFGNPTKPIGPLYEEAAARRLEAEHGWALIREHNGFRRAVPSPRPQRILEMETIALLVRAGVIVVCAGGGGIPVVVERSGAIKGVEAVIDKDRSAALLATGLGANFVMFLTDVEGVYPHWPANDDAPISTARPFQLRSLPLEPGSMGPKVEAACAFVETTGGTAAIGRLQDAAAILRGEKGTRIETG